MKCIKNHYTAQPNFCVIAHFYFWVNFFYVRRHVSFCGVLLFFIYSPYNTIWSWHVIKTNSSHDVVFHYQTKQSAIKLFLYKIWFYSWSHYQTDFHVNKYSVIARPNVFHVNYWYLAMHFILFRSKLCFLRREPSHLLSQINGFTPK